MIPRYIRRFAPLGLALGLIILMAIALWRERQRADARRVDWPLPSGPSARDYEEPPEVEAGIPAAGLEAAVPAMLVPDAHAEPASPATPVEDAARAETASQPDDLTVLTGVGPKLAAVLQGAGIATFSQLAATEPARLQEILRAAGMRLANYVTWPEQAALAASGDWEGLAALQAGLRRGRRDA